MIDYEVRRIDTQIAIDYIKKHHYSHGCHNGPSPCYGLFSPREEDGYPTMDLFDHSSLIGVLMFATPCSENVRASVFGENYKDWVIELHRLHILDCTPPQYGIMVYFQMSEDVAKRQAVYSCGFVFRRFDGRAQRHNLPSHQCATMWNNRKGLVLS